VTWPEMVARKSCAWAEDAKSKRMRTVGSRFITAPLGTEKFRFGTLHRKRTEVVKPQVSENTLFVLSWGWWIENQLVVETPPRSKVGAGGDA
jgi:hypothetical protein